MNPLRLVSWDVDGTLYDLRAVRRRIFGRVTGRLLRGRLADIREFRALLGYRSWIEAARRRAGRLPTPGSGPERARLLAAEQRWYGPAIHRTGPRPGLVELLDDLAAAGIPRVAFSDYVAGYKLEALGIRDRFDAVYEGELFGFVKPSPEGFHRIAADFHVAAESILHIGDRADTDGAACVSAGCRCLILGRDVADIHALRRRLPVRRAPRNDAHVVHSPGRPGSGGTP